MAQHFDLIVIGSGPAGRRAAVQAAKLKKSVLVVERGGRVGGVCVHTGTIPSKTLRETVLNLSGWRELRSRINDVRATWPPRPHAGKPTELARGLLWGATAHCGRVAQRVEDDALLRERPDPERGAVLRTAPLGIVSPRALCGRSPACGSDARSHPRCRRGRARASGPP